MRQSTNLQDYDGDLNFIRYELNQLCGARSDCGRFAPSDERRYNYLCRLEERLLAAPSAGNYY